jgi:WD40 repeat protein/ABC-type oligopeptide transport system substrate-binding subunit
MNKGKSPMDKTNRISSSGTNLNAFYTVGGTVQAGSGLYIPRRSDNDLLTLCQEAAFAYVLAPRQLGKSSLMIRTAERLQEEGILSVIIDLTQLGVQLSADAWYLGLLTVLEDSLMLDTDVVTWWQAHSHLGNAQRLILFFQDLVLTKLEQPLVVFVDEIDTTLSLDFTDDFYAAIRSLYVARARIPELKRLSFVLIGVASPGDLIRDPKRTPFNIGQRVEMTDFKLDEALPLSEGLGVENVHEKEALGWVFKWTGGHPYLTQRLCRVLAGHGMGAGKWGEGLTEERVDQAVNDTFFGQKSFQDNNLQFVRDMLTRRTNDLEEVLTSYREVRSRKRTVADEEQSLVKTHLKLSGVVKSENLNLKVRNPIYSTVFDEKWIKEHLPVNWAKRLRRALGIIAASLTLALIMGGLAVYALIQQSTANDRAADALSARNTAEARRLEAEKAQTETERQNLISRVQALSANSIAQLDIDPERSILLGIEAVKLAQQPGVESVLPQANAALRQSLEQAQLTSLTLDPKAGRIYDAEYSPDGRYIVTANNDNTATIWDALTGKAITTLKGHTNSLREALYSPDGHLILTTSIDGTTRIWEVQTGNALTTLQSHSGDLANSSLGGSLGRGAAFSPDSHLVVTAGEDGIARVWEAQTGQLKLELKGHIGPVNDARFSPDGRYIVTASDDNTAKLWDVASGQELTTLLGHTGEIYQANFSPDGRYVATASQDNTAMVFEVPTGRVVATLKGHQGYVFGAIFSWDNRTVLTYSTDDTAKLWEIPSGKELITYKGHTQRIHRAAFSPDGRYIVTAGNDSSARIWETQTGKEIFNFQGHTGYLESVAFSPDGRSVVSTGADGTARVWESLPGKDLATIFGQTIPFNSASFSPDGRSILTAGNDNTANIWDIQLRKTITTLRGHTDWVTSAVYSPDSKYIATASRDNTAKLWEAQSGKELLTFTGHAGPLNNISFSPDGHYIVTASRDQTARLWDVQTGQTITTFNGHTAELTTATFSPDGKYIVTASLDGTARVWESASGKPLDILSGHTGLVNSASFSPDGKNIVTAGRDGTVRLWEVQSGKEVTSFKGHTAEVNRATFSPDGKNIVTASVDGTARVWEIASGKEIATIKGHNGAVYSAWFSPDGNYVVTTGVDNTAQIQIVTSQELLKVAQGRVNRSLTADERVQFGLDQATSAASITVTAPVDVTTSAASLPSTTAISSSPSLAPTTISPTISSIPNSVGSPDLIEDVTFDKGGKYGGTLNLPSFAGTTDNPYTGGGTQVFLSHATLLGVNDHGKYFPYLLAQAPTLANGGVKLSADGNGMDLILKLKPGLMWNDGSPLTSKDVAFTVKWVNDPDQDGGIAVDLTVWNRIIKVDTPDNQTAVLSFNQIYSPYLDFLANFFPIPEKVWGKIPVKNWAAADTNGGGVNAISSGPFKVTEEIDSGRVTMVRNDYFSPVFGFNAYLDKIIFRPYPDENGVFFDAKSNETIAQGIAKGELDAVDFGKDQFDIFSKIPNMHSVTEQQEATEYLQLNLTNPLFQDKAVRQALNLALDKNALIKMTPYLVVAPSALMMPSIMLFADHSLQPSAYDPTTAKQLLESAGWKIGPDGIRVKNGQRLAFSFVTTIRSHRPEIAQAIVAYWKAVGAEVTAQVINFSDLFDGWEANGKLVRGQYDVGMFAQSLSLDNDYFYINYHSGQIPSDTNPNGANYGRINNPIIDQALDLQRTTVDPAQRYAAWKTIQQILYNNVYEIPLFTYGTYWWVSDRVKNFKPFQFNFWNAVEMYMD